MLKSRAMLLNLMFFMAGLIACGDSGGPADVVQSSDAGMNDQSVQAPLIRPVARFTPSQTLSASAFGEIPYPNNIYLSAEGTVNIDSFPLSAGGTIVGRLREQLAQHVKGFACAGTHYVSFEGPLDTSLLPEDGAASLSMDSSLYLVDVDTASPFKGTRYPLRWRFTEAPTNYLPSNTLAVRPVEGSALRPKTTYALIVSTAIALPNETFGKMLDTNRPAEWTALWDIYEPLRNEEFEIDSIAVASVFTTMDPVSEMFQLANFIDGAPSPTVQSLVRTGSFPGLYVEYQGTYQAPNFQTGEPPFLTDGGYIEYDEQGQPRVQRIETLRFSVAIPSNMDMPASGWPVVMYGHGTGGDYRSYINSGAAATLARVGIATIGIDQVHHGTRDLREDNCARSSNPSSCVSALFFNFVNPLAGRDNVRQSAADFVSLARLLRTQTLMVEEASPTESPDAPPVDGGIVIDEMDAGLGDSGRDLYDAGDLPDGGVADGSVLLDGGTGDEGSLAGDQFVLSEDAGAETIDGGQENVADETDSSIDGGDKRDEEATILRFDPNGLMYLGHSQGGINGPLFLAVDKNVSGGMLSASGGNIAITLEQKRRPFDIAGFAEMLVMLSDNETLDRWHPIFMLIQTFIEPGDPINYARFWFEEPRENAKPKSIFMTAGLDDEYTPPDSIFSLAASGGVPIIPPIRVPIELNEIRGIEPSGIPPFDGNVAEGNAAAGLLQVPNVGHFVFQDDITIRNRYKQFFKSIVDGNPQIF